MRDVFAIAMIVLAVVALGLFRVPNDNALLDAGIRAEAQSLVAGQPHPIGISVERSVLTVAGRVESVDAQLALVTALAGMDGVEGVEDALTVLPEAAPFMLEIDRGAEGYSVTGYIASEAQRAQLAALFGDKAVAGLTVASGVPDGGWVPLVLRVAKQMPRMLEGRLRVEDRTLHLSGRVHLPGTLDAMRAALADLPEDYSLTLAIAVVDDGRPYHLSVVRDPLMGLRVAGKVPPDWDENLLDPLGEAQSLSVQRAPLSLDQPGFDVAVGKALSVFADVGQGALSVTPEAVALSGGPVSSEIFAKAEALRDQLPDTMALTLALIPQDDAAPLRLSADWDGARLSLAGKVPQDFTLPAQAEARAVTRAPYPDLAGWAARAETALGALMALEGGRCCLREVRSLLMALPPIPNSARVRLTHWARGRPRSRFWTMARRRGSR